MPSVASVSDATKSVAVTFDAGVGMCNAIRRTLQHDVKTWAPYKLTVQTNTTCQTDEFIAHRIGLIPFRRVGSGETMRIDCTGPCTLVAGDAIGPSFEPVYPNIPVMEMGDNHQLKCTVHFDFQAASTHARYAPCAGVGMSVDNGKCKLRFDVINGAPPLDILNEAIDCFEKRIDDALLALANQPETPPDSFC